MHLRPDRLSTFQNAAIDLAPVGHFHDVDDDFGHVHFVDDSVSSNSDAVGVLSSSQTSGANRNGLFGQAIDGRLDPVVNLGGEPELLGDSGVK